MKWPWVSRARLDDALGQIEYLREQLSRAALAHTALQEQMVRISRREAGLPEVPREPRPPLEPMPKDIADYIQGYASPSIQRAEMRAAYRQHGAGVPWTEIRTKVMTHEEVP